MIIRNSLKSLSWRPFLIPEMMDEDALVTRDHGTTDVLPDSAVGTIVSLIESQSSPVNPGNRDPFVATLAQFINNQKVSEEGCVQTARAVLQLLIAPYIGQDTGSSRSTAGRCGFLGPRQPCV